MLTSPTLDKLRAMDLVGMARALQEPMEPPHYEAPTFEERLGPAVLSGRLLQVDHGTQSLLEGRRLVVGALHLLLKGAGHTHQVHGSQLVQGRAGQHRSSPYS